MVIWVKNTMFFGSFAISAMSANLSPADLFQLRQFGVVFLLSGQPQIGQGDRIEIVVRQGDIAEALAPQLDNFFNDALKTPLPRFLPIGAPDRAKRAVLGATTHRLHRSPHIFVRRQQVPARGNKLVRVDPASLVDLFWLALHASVQHLGPDDVAIALDHAVRMPTIQGFFGVKRGVNAAIDYPGAALSCLAADFIAPQGIPGVDPDADKVSRLND